MLILYSSFLWGLILSNALRAQKNAGDESCTIALGNLRSKVIKLRNKALEKDKILFSLVEKVKEDEAKFNTQSEIYKAEIEDLRKELAKANENFAVAKASQEISEWSKTRLEKNVEELRESKERCFEKSLDCVKKLKTSFAKVGAYSSEDNFIRGDPEGVIDWISGEAEAFEEILSVVGISVLLLVLEVLWQFWRSLVATTLKLQPRLKPPSPQTTRKTLRLKLHWWAENFIPMSG
jgi:hypothetical protein